MGSRSVFLELEDGVSGRSHEVGLNHLFDLLMIERIMIEDLFRWTVSFPELIKGLWLLGIVRSHDEGSFWIDLVYFSSRKRCTI